MTAPSSHPHDQVSIVIPAYNHGRYIAEAIESVLAQDHPLVELIVIDDGSTDHTVEVLNKYADRARVLSQTNKGQATTINRGWSEARGDVLSYLSADDRLEPDAVSRALAALRAHPEAVMVYGDYRLIDPHSAFVRLVTAPDFDYMAMVRDLVCAPGPGVFLRRWAVERLDGWRADLRQGPDFEYWLRLALIGPFFRTPHVLAELRVHPGSASYATMSSARAEEPVRMMASYFERTDLPEEARAVQRRSLSWAHMNAARGHLRSGRWGSSISALWKAGRLSPSNLLSVRVLRLVANALMNRTGHQLLWLWRRRSGRSERPS